jgi:hypothetical protein
MLIEEEPEFWLRASESSLAEIWDNLQDEEYAKLLEKRGEKMSASELLTVLRARPFRPLRLCMSDGTIYEVRHPELVIVALGTAVVGYPSPDHPGAAERYDILSLRHVVRIEFIDVPEPTASAQPTGNADGGGA